MNASRRSAARAYTLIEVLVVVTVLGIAAAMIVPSMDSAGVLRVQAAVRTVVADLTFAQSDALAFQNGRAVVFYPDENRYVICEVRGTTIDPDNDRISESRFNASRFGDSRIHGARFGDGSTLIFDEMGGPVTEAGGNVPAPNGTITINGSRQRFEITVEGYTGRVTVRRVADEDTVDPDAPE
jgi:prepilin-type N-terminal cleavage/methylation domain-containing protein